MYWNYTAYGDGNVYSTVEDLFRWDQNFYEPRLGKGRFLEIMHTFGRLRDGTPCRYAFGMDAGEFCPDNWRGEPIFAHGGSNAGFESLLLRVPGRRFTVIQLCNTCDSKLKPKTFDVPRLAWPGVRASARGNETGPPCQVVRHCTSPALG